MGSRQISTCKKDKFLIVDSENINMEGKKIGRVEGLDEVALPGHSVVAVAISGSKKSKFVLEWALDKFVSEGLIYFKLLHIRPVISRIPTPMGNYIPVSRVREGVVAAFAKEMEWQVAEKLLPYKNMCTQRKVHIEIAQIESDDVVAAISGDIKKHKINKLVIGTSSRNIFSRAPTLSSKISECCPTFCAVYTVYKGKLSSFRPSDSEANQSLGDNSSDSSCSIENTSSQSFSSQSDWTDQGMTSRFRSASLPMQRFQSLSSMNQTLLHRRMPSTGIRYPSNLSLDYAERSNGTNIVPSGSDVNDTNGRASSFASSMADDPSGDQASASETSTNNQAILNFELEKLRTELRHKRGMYAMAQIEAIDTSRKLNELEKRHEKEEMNLKQIILKEEEAEELARREKKRYEAAKREAELVKDCAEREAVERKEAGLIVSRKTKENENLESVLSGCSNQYRLFTWEEIEFATSSFSDNLKIGMGAYGTVYKCSFQHTTAAVKVLHAKENSITKQFQQELEILSRIRHPHLLILLGACPEKSCLVYELMENGSLQDTLSKKSNAPPLLWFGRVRIAWEVASALVFLHNAKPNPIIHRDLKPANILLDRNNVSKIGDFGLSRIINMDTSPVGTLCYIDPEYQRTGVVSPNSDVYALGMVILQLLTGQPAIALAHKVETAMESDSLMEILDPEAGGWPIEEAKDLALVGLKCIELRQIDRPDLEEEVLPVLEKLKDSAKKARCLELVSAAPPPKHFICPILNEVMRDPCVAADGYTYERRAIEAWLEEKDRSPMTKLQLPHKDLLPNYTLLSAIVEWQSGKQT